MKRLFLSASILASFTALLAQTNWCHTDNAVSRLRAENPAYDAGMAAWKNAISQAAQQALPASGSRGTLYTVPIVFHVILQSQSQINAVIAQIPQQVATLNRDFRKQNSDTSVIRSIFKPLASDIEIEFCLAVRDPNGNAANGYTTTVTTHAPWDPDTEGDDMKSAANGGHNAWNTTKYVNVWVVDIAGSQFGGTAGYAYIGSAGVHGSSVDGIVLDYSLGFGSNNRSLSHEMGHYFGLYHTWGNVGGCSDDDGISDTPESSTANYDCNFGVNSCNTGAGDLPDQVENHMDYSTCPVMFTTQQKAVMRNILTGVRASLITNNLGCQGVNVPPVANFSAAETTVCPGSSVAFTDNSTNLPTSWSWTFPGGTPSASSQQNPTVTYSTPGVYNVSLTVSNAFGSDSETKTGYITVGSGGTATLFSEDFEGSFPGLWTISNPDNGLTWESATVSGSTSGTKAARVNCYNYPTIGARDGLISPVISLAGHTQISLTFNYAHRRYSTNETDSLIVYASINGGTSYPYKVYANAGGAGFATGYLYQGNFVPSAAEDWCFSSATGVTCPVIDLAAFSGQASFRLKIEIVNDYGNNIYVDNVTLTGICSGNAGAPVASFTASQTSGCNSLTVNFTDQSTNSPTSWSWQFTGGTPASSTQQNPTVTYSTPGAYTVTLTATNANGSNSKTSANYINVYTSPSTAASSVDASCPGVNNGSIDLTVIGGTSPFTYQWSNTAATTQDISGLSPGTYTVTVTDAHSCTATRSVTISAGAAITLSANVQDDTSGAGTGGITLSVSNGTSPFTYQWSNGRTTSSINNLTAGTYNVTVTDVNGCSATGSYTVNNIGVSPVANFSGSPASGCGSITVNFTDQSANSPTSWVWLFPGGTPSSSTQKNPTITYSTPGTYNVTLTVTNATGSNSKTSNSYISVYANPSASVTKTDATCAGVNDGSADLSVTGGTPPYTYHWSDNAASQDLTNVAAGNYSVTVTDANSCTATQSVTISAGAGLQLTATIQDDAGGAGVGGISLTVTNGTGSYNYTWSNGETTQAINGLTAGNYSVTVTDVTGCQATGSYTVGDSGLPPVASFTASQTSSCGSMTVTFTDQSLNSPTSWYWTFSGGNPSSSTERNPSVTYSSPGSYNVTLTVSNSNGSNTTSISGYINVYENPVATITKEDASCQEVSDGSADLKLVGGTRPYSYSWSNGATTEDLSNAAAGSYSITVTDARGCSASASVVIASGAPLQLNPVVRPDSTGSGTGSITVSVVNGTSPYDFAWSNGATSSSISGLTVDDYSVTVTDASGCQASATYTVGTNVSVVNPADAGWTYQIYPNPVSERLNISVKTSTDSELRLILYNPIGEKLSQESFSNSPEINAQFDMSNFEEGIYFLRIETENRSTVSRVVVVRN